MTACMGGWCPKRERCQRYNETFREAPAERLCEPGQSNRYEPVQPKPERPTEPRTQSE